MTDPNNPADDTPEPPGGWESYAEKIRERGHSIRDGLGGWGNVTVPYKKRPGDDNVKPDIVIDR